EPIGPGEHGRALARALHERREIVTRVHEVQPLAIAGDERRVRPARAGVDGHGHGQRGGVRACAEAHQRDSEDRLTSHTEPYDLRRGAFRARRASDHLASNMPTAPFVASANACVTNGYVPASRSRSSKMPLPPTGTFTVCTPSSGCAVDPSRNARSKIPPT